MNNAIQHPLKNSVRLLLITAFVFALTFGTSHSAQAFASPAPVDLGTAGTFVILTKTGITNVPTSAITGDMGVSPITYASITGFALIPTVPNGSNTYATSAQVTGKIYAADYTEPTPTNLGTAIGDMETAYTNAAGRTLPDATELGAGDISGLTLAPGLYKWGTGVSINTDVTLAGSSTDVWIFQIAGDLTVASDVKVLLSGGARAKNIFWQVGGDAGVEIGTTAHMEGTILALKDIHMRTGATMNGRLLSQTQVTLDQNTVVIPTFNNKTMVFTSNANADGWVLESSENSKIGSTRNTGATTLNVGDDALNKQYRGFLHFNTNTLPDRIVITSVVLMINAQGPVGTDPFGTHGDLLVDVRKPFFGLSAGLVASDFQAAGTSNVAKFDVTPLNNWYRAVLKTSSFGQINRIGTTQFRLRFNLDDNNNLLADFMAFYSGNAGNPALRPQLIVNYYVP